MCSIRDRGYSAMMDTDRFTLMLGQNMTADPVVLPRKHRNIFICNS